MTTSTDIITAPDHTEAFTRASSPLGTPREQSSATTLDGELPTELSA